MPMTSVWMAGESEDLKRTLPQKTVTCADREPVVVLNPRHSLESFSSQSSCVEPPSASSSRQSSREGSPAATTGRGYVEHTQLTVQQLGGFVGTPPLMTRRRPALEGRGAVVMFPSPPPPPPPHTARSHTHTGHSLTFPPPPPPSSISRLPCYLTETPPLPTSLPFSLLVRNTWPGRKGSGYPLPPSPPSFLLLTLRRPLRYNVSYPVSIGYQDTWEFVLISSIM